MPLFAVTTPRNTRERKPGSFRSRSTYSVRKHVLQRCDQAGEGLHRSALLPVPMIPLWTCAWQVVVQCCLAGVGTPFRESAGLQCEKDVDRACPPLNLLEEDDLEAGEALTAAIK